MIDKNRVQYINQMVNIIRDVFDLNNDIDEKDLFKIVNELNGHIKYNNESIYPVNIKKIKTHL